MKADAADRSRHMRLVVGQTAAAAEFVLRGDALMRLGPFVSPYFKG